LICVCTDLKKVGLELGMSPSRVSVIGNGVDTARFRPREQAHARQRLGLSPKMRIVLSVGHLTRRKGFDLLVGAIAMLRRHDLRLVVAGDGPERSALEDLARERGIADSVIFGGAIANNDLPDWYAAADLFALASSREGWPNVVCEAQAMGLPVVATSVWGIPEIIDSPSLGVLVDERTEPAIAQALSAALNTDWDRDRIARVGMRRTWDSVADELQAIFATVARASPRDGSSSVLEETGRLAR
jgi:glycosyltransferase involved in cell wall biosynthesis